MSERNPKRFEDGSNAQQRSAEEQRRLMEEYDQARYEEAFPVDEDAEKTYNDAMEAREFEANAAIEGRIMERHENSEGKMVLVRPEANRMYMLAQQVAELRANGGEPRFIEEKENRLQELLEAYTEQAHADRDLAVRNAEINERSTVKGRENRLQEEAAAEDELKKRLEEADFIINSTDEAWVNERSPKAAAEKETPADTGKEKSRDLEAEEDSLLSRIEELMKEIKADPDAAEKSGAYDRAREELAKLDEAIAKRKAAEEIKTPKDAADTDGEIKTPKDAAEAGDEEIKTPRDAKEDGEEIKTPRDAKAEGDDEEIKTPKDAKDTTDTGSDEEIRTPRDAEMAEEGEDEPVRQGLLKRAWNRIAAFGYQTDGASPAGVVRHGLERFRDSENKGKIAAFIAAAAIIGVGAWGRTHGWFDGGGQGGNAKPDDFTPGQKGGHPGGTGIEETPPAPTPTGPEIPTGDSFAHPWNWMKAAMENGSIKAPAGMGPEDALHYYGEQAAAAGHKVEWYNLPNGLEAIRVDGNDDTKAVADVLSQFAK